MATEVQIKQWRKELMKDYPTTDPYFIDLVLDLYKYNPDYIKKLPKKKVKPVETTPIEKEVVGAVSVIPADDTETINKYFKQPIELKDDEHHDDIKV